MDNELICVWQLVNELSKQLAQNQKLTNTLHRLPEGVFKQTLC